MESKNKNFKKVLFRRKLYAKLAETATMCKKPLEYTGKVFATFFFHY